MAETARRLNTPLRSERIVLPPPSVSKNVNVAAVEDQIRGVQYVRWDGHLAVECLVCDRQDADSEDVPFLLDVVGGVGVALESVEGHAQTKKYYRRGDRGAECVNITYY